MHVSVEKRSPVFSRCSVTYLHGDVCSPHGFELTFALTPVRECKAYFHETAFLQLVRQTFQRINQAHVKLAKSNRVSKMNMAGMIR